eukprot:2451765-Pyramimonas_sp.AAC.1
MVDWTGPDLGWKGTLSAVRSTQGASSDGAGCPDSAAFLKCHGTSTSWAANLCADLVCRQGGKGVRV